MSTVRKIVVFGYGYQGYSAAKLIMRMEDVEFYGFADNSEYKQGCYAWSKKILCFNELKALCHNEDVEVVIAAGAWKEIEKQCNDEDVPIYGIYLDGRISRYPFADFSKLDFSHDIRLYAGDICDEYHLNESNLYGLSLKRNDDRHIKHNITQPYPLPDDCVSSYEAECVFEYIEYNRLQDVINEIWRILKRGGVLRVCLPDNNSPIIKRRVMTDKNGNILFDVGCGGNYGKDGICDGGSVWFPTYDNFADLLNNTKFNRIEWLCYFSNDEILHRRKINSDNGYVNRVMGCKDEDIYSMVIDCYK